MSRYQRWQRTEHTESSRIVTMLLVAPVFLGLLPFVVAGLGPRFDRLLGQGPIRLGRGGRLAGALVSAAGFAIGLWTVLTQMDRGRGTPLPMMPTQELLTGGPYRFCRNPMTLGAILAYLGIAIAARTRAGIALVLSLAGILLVYLRRAEEAELVERFGDAYSAYKATTPFIIPRLP